MGERIEAAISKMSLEEKAAMVQGADFWNLASVPRLGIRGIWVADGPHGLRKVDAEGNPGFSGALPATCFPTASALASSWDPGLLREVGVALAEECRAEGVSVLLGPGVNIKRSPLCGRNFEYYSEDPFLAGELAVAFIEGVQSLGVGTSLKHFAANNEEHLRKTIDAVVDERSLRELYLPAFEAAVRRARPWTVMCAYNRLNGSHCAENAWLLDTILRKDWGFEGVLVSDWGACNDRVAGLEAGQDLEMPYPGPGHAREIVEAVRRGRLDEAVLDRSVRRVLELIDKGGRGTMGATDPAGAVPAAGPAMAAGAAGAAGAARVCDYEAHHELARRAARESMVLLRNEDGILPLRPGARLAVIGDMARQPRYQGSGSSLINPRRLDTILGEMGDYSHDVVFAQGYRQDRDLPDEGLVAEAVLAAREADVAVVFVGLTASYEVEGADRSHLGLPPAHEALIEAVAEANPSTVVVLASGSAVEMPWLSRVRAVLETFLSGEAGAGATLDLLFGRASPSGRLSETFPASLADLPSTRFFPEGPATVEYREGLYVGYRWFTSSGEKPLFPFGFGLSYTEFGYSGLALSASTMCDTDILGVEFSLRNTGKCAGAEVAQLYVAPPDGADYRPARELKAFSRVFLAPGEERRVALDLVPRAFAHWDRDLGGWRVEPGEYRILVGASSEDIRLEAKVSVAPKVAAAAPTSVSSPARDGRTTMACYHSPHGPGAAFAPSDAEFAALLGREPPAKARPRNAAFDMNSTLEELGASLIGRILFRVAMAVGKSTEDRPDAATERMLEVSIREMPLRNVAQFSGGRPGFGLLRFLLALMNLGRKPRRDARP
jgi:beta-glucosidase